MKTKMFWICLAALAFGFGQNHSAFQSQNIRPSAVDWPIGAMDFMSDGRMVVTSWKDPYEVHFITNVLSGDKSQMRVTTYATGLKEMFGVKVINDSIYVVQKDELTLLLDHDSDGVADEYRCITMDWSRTTNEKNYAFGLGYDGEFFYVAFNGDLISSATLRTPQPPGRQNAVYQISKQGDITFFAGGLRVPSGVGMGYGELWITENQGGYRPSDPLINVRKDRWYGRQADTDPLPFLQPYSKKNTTPPGDYSPHAIHFPHLDLMRSPGTPVVIPSGPYAGQMLIPDCSVASEAGAGGIRRAFLEKVDGEYQGAAFRFIRDGFDGGGVWDIKFGPDGNLYAAGNGSAGAGWDRFTHVGLDRLVPTNNVPFEMKAIRNLGGDAFEIEFTKPIGENGGADVRDRLNLTRYWFDLRDAYGAGAKMDETNLNISSAVVSQDQTKIRVAASGIQEGQTYYFHWDSNNSLKSGTGENMLYREGWYNLIHYGPGEDAVPVIACGDPEYTEFNAARDGTDNDLCVTLKTTQPKANLKSGFSVDIVNAQMVKISLPYAGNWEFALVNLQGKSIPIRLYTQGTTAMFETQNIPTGLYIVTGKLNNRVFMDKLTLFK